MFIFQQVPLNRKMLKNVRNPSLSPSIRNSQKLYSRNCSFKCYPVASRLIFEAHLYYCIQCFIGNHCWLCLIVHDEWTPNLLTTSTAVAMEPNQESLPNHPPFCIFLHYQLMRALLLYGHKHLIHHQAGKILLQNMPWETCSGFWTTSITTKTPDIHSTPLWNTVRGRSGFQGSKL